MCLVGAIIFAEEAYAETRRVQKRILRAYDKDFIKHAEAEVSDEFATKIGTLVK